MAELRFETFEMPIAPLGPDNPLPKFPRPKRRQRPRTEPHPSLTEEDLRYMGYGVGHGLLPYTVQSEYTRSLERRPLRAAVLENETLKAVFLLEWGGRLWSLLHKPTGRELLARNPGICLANFALRGAWFSGGVEWNGCVSGHGPFTCSPLFAARVAGLGGNPVLRLYEWERIRGIPFQMDFYLPDDRPVLLARMRVRNPHSSVVPMYWWSNIAVPEADDVRVLVPAREAINYGYDHCLRRVPVPRLDDRDVSYSANLDGAVDFFYCIEGEQRPWITAVDGTGRGLFHASTSRLKGRKLFAWGRGPGGGRWQEFLSGGGPDYIELQAGLARTQGECLPMPAHAEWEWLEAYGTAEVDPAVAHGEEWHVAWRHVDTYLDRTAPQRWLEDELQRSRGMALRPPEEVMQQGSGWGALELQRRAAAREKPFCSRALVFGDESLGAEQEPWRALLATGIMPETPPGEAPRSWMVQPEWRRLLEGSLEGEGAHWLSWLHVGVMRHNAGEVEAARDAYRRSLDDRPSAWAYRNLAVLADEAGREAESADLLLNAASLAPGCVPLWVECVRALLHADRAQDAADLLDRAKVGVASHPRVRILRAQAALAADDLDTVECILLSCIELSDLREGEEILTDLWFALQEKRAALAACVPVNDALKQCIRCGCPPPPGIDFRMAGT